MKINKIVIGATLGLCPLIYHACNEKNIDLLPGTQTEASFFTEEQQFERAVLGVYAKLTDFYWYGAAGNPGFMHGVWLLPGDDVTTAAENPFEVFYNLNATTEQLNNFYRNLYQLVNRSNIVLQKIAGVAEGVYTSPNLKNYNQGEALFLRGYANFLLWNYFGTAPLVTERIQTPDEITPPNATGNALLDQAIADFQAAAELLPATWEARNRGRVTNSSANGFLGKALVFRATVTKNNADYTAALAAFNKITDKSLMPAFEANFDNKQENNAESLFEFQASQPGFDNVWLANDFDNLIGSISAYYGYYENHWSLFNAPIYSGTVKLFNAYEPEDPRRDLTVKRNPDDVKVDYQMQKYWTQDQKSQTGVASVNNTRILRYADVLLLKAEALVQSGGSPAEAVQLVNQVRARARSTKAGSLAPLDRPVVTDAATVMDYIRTERFLELAGEEGHRWLDLRRWHLGGQLDLTQWDFSSVRADVAFTVKNLYFPIPTAEIDLNPNIVQNTGY